jgi:hypothetical protein
LRTRSFWPFSNVRGRPSARNNCEIRRNAGNNRAALGKTEGGEIRMSMGIVLIGGLLSSLFLTLFLVPAMYVTVNRVAGWLDDWRARRAERAAVPDDGSLRPPRVAAGAMGD